MTAFHASPIPAAGSAPPAALNGQPPCVQLLRLALGEYRYALGIEHVREILHITQLTALPLMPAFVRGVMNLRGAVVPVIDLGARLGLDVATLTRRSCVVIVETRSGGDSPRQTLGLLVDAVHEVADVPLGGLEPVPALGVEIAAEHLEGMARIHGEIVPVLALVRVLDEATLTSEITHHTQDIATQIQRAAVRRVPTPEAA